MAEDFDENTKPAADPLAAQIAMAADAAAAEDARAYLREQAELARLQKQNLLELNAFELSHLRWRRFNDQMKGALQIMLVAVGALVLAGFGFMIWNACNSGGLVIEAFSVPPDLANRGLTGQVVANKLLDRLAAMQAQTDSQRDPQTFANFWGDNIKVQIPETGISLGELNRYLRETLGHPTLVTGEIVHDAQGISLTARAGTQGNGTVSGLETDIDALVQTLAESIYGITEPYRYGAWLREHGRDAEGLAVMIQVAKHGPMSERPWGYLGWGIALQRTAGIYARLKMMQVTFRKWPRCFLAGQNAAEIEDTLSHPEQSVAGFRAVAPLLSTSGHGGIRPDVVPTVKDRVQSFIDLDLGNFREAAALWKEQIDFGPQGVSYNMHAKLARAQLGEHDLAAARATMADPAEAGGINMNNGAFDIVTARMAIEVEAGNWRTALAQYHAAAALFARYPGLRSVAPSTEFPLLAFADARLGTFNAADAMIARTPADCYRCLIARAQISELENRWASAGWWLARAVKQAPDIPFAYADWGAMLLQKGDLDGAIAKFRLANEKGPHFADPLEYWGEALIRKNRSDLALAKFAQAAKYAPNWGRLHLKWGEALLWSGDKKGAQKQFAIAAHLDLTPAEKSQLARMEAGRG
jgi:tetratricopeptide (TPR) repeat protein